MSCCCRAIGCCALEAKEDSPKQSRFHNGGLLCFTKNSLSSRLKSGHLPRRQNQGSGIIPAGETRYACTSPRRWFRFLARHCRRRLLKFLGHQKVCPYSKQAPWKAGAIDLSGRFRKSQNACLQVFMVKSTTASTTLILRERKLRGVWSLTKLLDPMSPRQLRSLWPCRIQMAFFGFDCRGHG